MAAETPARRLRITFLIGSLDIGGAETQLVRLVNALDRTRFQPSVLCLYGGGPLEMDLAADVPVSSASIHSIRHGRDRSRVLLAIRILRVILRELRRQRPDILHAYLPTAYVLGGVAAWLFRVPVIIAARRGLTSYHIYPYRRWRWLAKFANRVIDLHLCNSESVRNYAIEREGVDRARTAVVYNGIELPPADQPVPRLPDRWRPPGTTILVGVIANLIAYKGHATLLEALTQVVSDFPGLGIVLIGDGPERQALEAQARRLGLASRVVFAGRYSNAATLVRAFDFTVLASTEEGFPNAIMESMANAVPVVATDAGGTRELVEDGVTGILIMPGNAEALADGIRRMAADPEGRRRMGTAARFRVAKRLGVRRMVSATEALYQQLSCKRSLSASARSTCLGEPPSTDLGQRYSSAADASLPITNEPDEP